MPIKNYHGLYGTIMSAMPIDIKNEIDLSCEKNGYLKSVLVLKLFGGYHSRNIISQWFSAMWGRYKSSGGVGVDNDLEQCSRTHYDKVVKIIPPTIKRDLFIYAAVERTPSTVESVI